jgi:glycosyltransferase involved in cell wall biosynthesis
LFVVWQGDANRYVLPTREEFAQLGQFNGPWLSNDNRLSPSASERVDLEQALERFGRRDPWIIFSETMMEARFQPIRRYVRRLNLLAAAIFYDAIPVLRPDLCNEETRDNHRGYMLGLAECDVVVPISHYSARCLREFWDAQGVAGCAVHADVLPGEFGGSGRVAAPPADSDLVRMLCVSTLEPRKNHRRLVEACLALKQSHPNLRWELTLVGNKYQGAFEIADWIQEVSRQHPEVQWLGIVDDDTLRRLYGEAAFTIYPSVMEGFGLPIVESIWHGRPCICSPDGVMGELAREGGCLTADVQDVPALSGAIAALAEDRQLQRRLFRQAVARELKTWDGYVAEFLGILAAAPPPVPVAAAPQPGESVPADGPVAWTDVLYPSCILRNWQMHDGERLALLALLARHKPHCSIEIGTYYGGSLSLMAQFSDMVFSIDIDPEVLHRVRPMPNVTLLTGDSAEVLPVLFRELTASQIAVDFILIDGDHSKAGLKRDIGLVLQYVPLKPLFVVMHDCLNPGCREAMIESPWYDSPYCHWVELDLVPGRPVDNEEAAHGELWGGLAVAFLQPTPRQGPLVVNRTADSLFRTMAANFQAKSSGIA